MNLHSTLFILVLSAVIQLACMFSNLHSTLFILVPTRSLSAKGRKLIYIPLCLY